MLLLLLDVFSGDETRKQDLLSVARNIDEARRIQSKMSPL